MSQIKTKFLENSAVTAAKIASGAVESSKININADLSFNSFKITSLADPSAAQDAATKAYVDSVANGLDVKGSVRVASTANVALSGGATLSVDGVSLANGDRVLLKDQTTASQNGIYVVSGIGTAYSLARSSDADANAEVTSGMFTFVEEGTVNADSGWVLVTNNPIVVGTTALSFSQFSGAGSIVAGEGLSKTGNTLDVDHDGQGLTFVSNQLALELDGATLSKSASGLKVADAGIGSTQLADDSVTAAKVNADVAGNGLSQAGGGALDVNVDGSTLEINADALRIKDAGVSTAKVADDAITKEKIAADVAGNGLGQNVDGSLEVNVDGSTLEINTDALRVKDAGIVTAKLADDSVTKEKVAADVAGNGLGQNVDGSLEVKVDNATIKIASDQLQGLKPFGKVQTLTGTDISNGYIDLDHTAHSAGFISLSVVGGIEQEQGVDYTVSLSGGGGGATRLTFAGGLASGGASELVNGDKLILKYAYL